LKQAAVDTNFSPACLDNIAGEIDIIVFMDPAISETVRLHQNIQSENRVDMETVYSLLFVTAIIIVIRAMIAVQNEINDRRLMKEDVDIERQKKEKEQSRIPFFRLIYYKFLEYFRTRVIDDFESIVDCDGPDYEMELKFHVHRRPVKIVIYLSGATEAILDNIVFLHKGEEITGKYRSRTFARRDGIKVVTYVPKVTLMDKIIFRFEKTADVRRIAVQTRLMKDKFEDYELYHSALGYFRTAQYAAALEDFLRYMKLAPHNPDFHLVLCQLYMVMENLKKAEQHALLAAVNGRDEIGLGYYRSFQRDRLFMETKEIERLNREADQWDLDYQYGTMTLLKRQEITHGLDGWYLLKSTLVLKLRRSLAARMRRNIQFEFSSGKYLLTTGLRIIGADGHIFELPRERFTSGDSPGKNIYITTRDNKVGTWILPNLSSGDIIELQFHLLCDEGRSTVDGRTDCFIILSPADYSCPTLSGIIEHRLPPDWPIEFNIGNQPDIVRRHEDSADGQRSVSFRIEKYIPVNNIDFAFENSFLNPIVSCGTAGNTWEGIAREIYNHYTDNYEIDELPPVLAEIIEKSGTPRRALRKAFYWVRDKLKYASIGSALGYIGKPGRAGAIVESGVGDCKDKSYLLFLVSKKLGLEAEFVTISTENGIIVENLPADQFDHILLRVNLDGHWHYLDAASAYAVFDSNPGYLQGLKILALNDEGTIETIDIDPPEKNVLIFTETFENIKADRLQGTFHLLAAGNGARLLDENWKWQSLQARDHLQSAQLVLRSFLPNILLKSYDRLSQTTNSDTFEVLGVHNRCQFSPLGERNIGIIEWNDPNLPLDYWQTLQLDRLFLFHQTTHININLIFSQELKNRMLDYSVPVSMGNDICDITCKTNISNDSLTVSRNIVIKKKFVGQDEIHLIPEIMTGMDKALQMALSFRRD